MGTPKGAETRQPARLAMLAAVLALALGAHAAEPYEATTLSFRTSVPKDGKVQLLWEGEIVNNSTSKATLCAVVQLLDKDGAVLEERETASVNVGRFVREKRSEAFSFDAGLWAKVDAIEQAARLSLKQPVNGRRIFQVDLYTTSWCPYCAKAKAYLVGEGIDFTEYDVEQDPEAEQRRTELAQKKSVPVMVVDGKVLVGFSEASYAKAFAPPAASSKGK